MYDYHTHSNYSDGTFMHRMIMAAKKAGLDGIGFSDHCNVSQREAMIDERDRNAFNLDLTMNRRENAIDQLRDTYDIRIFDAVEMDFHPADQDDIGVFLDDAGFEYVIGSVHRVNNKHVQDRSLFQGMSENAREDIVATYFENLLDMIESGLVDVVAHIDVFERNPLLRGMATDDQYEMIAEALERADAVPEINAGRVLRSYGTQHPHPDFLDILTDYDISFVRGTDSHRPKELVDRNTWLTEFADQDELTFISPFK